MSVGLRDEGWEGQAPRKAGPRGRPGAPSFHIQ